MDIDRYTPVIAVRATATAVPTVAVRLQREDTRLRITAIASKVTAVMPAHVLVHLKRFLR
jgi:hypothetical protein